MSKEYTSVRVSVDAKATADESKRDGETWDEFIQRCAETPPATREFVDAKRLVDAIAAEAEDYRIDDTKLAAQVVQRLDYGELARAVADELEGRFR